VKKDMTREIKEKFFTCCLVSGESFPAHASTVAGIYQSLFETKEKKKEKKK
jgi:hypothetical protein